jgi:alpha-glucosidase
MTGVGAAPWWRGAVIYQIYPRSFCDSNGDGVGDLPGVTSKLDYVASLGVDGIWLSPFFRSPMKDFGYDVSDYCDVDPVFGTLADFDALLAKAHALGLKVIIDQVYSHTSEEHPWFVESRTSADNPKADWYVWAPAKPDGTPPNNWQASFGGPAWTWGPRRRAYYLHNFLTQQPDLNFHNPAVQDAVLDAARFWLDRGVDGFRLDVVNYFAQDPQLRDNPAVDWRRPPARTYLFQHHVHDKSQPETLRFVERLRALTDLYPDRMMVGEIVDDDELARQREYTEGEKRLHTAYSFHLIGGRKGEPKLFTEALEPWRGASGWPSWSIGNHDVPRYPTRLGEPGASVKQTKALLAALFCLRGTIFLYQGDELGLPQGQVRFEDLQDPFARAAYTGDAGRDGARTPFPWDASQPQAGFSQAAQTWLPVDPNHAALAVAGQEREPQSLLAFTRLWVALRAAQAALRTGEATCLEAAPGVLAIERGEPGEGLLCVINLGGTAARFERAGIRAHEVLACGLKGERDGDRLELPAFGGVILKFS